MIISFDTDGTKTDFNLFVEKYAIDYFKNKHGLEVVNPKGLEIEDIFDIENTLIKQGYSKEEAVEKQKGMLDKFWVSHRFILFSLLGKFRPGVSKTIKNFKKLGFTVNIDTARSKTCDKNIIGSIARLFTLSQYAINGVFIPRKNINFHKSDKDKIKALEEKTKNQEILLFDDKPEVIKNVSKFTKVVCVDSVYNEDTKFNENVERITGFEGEEAEKAVIKLIGKRRFNYLKRKNKAAKYHLPAIKGFASTVEKMFDPIILNKENLIDTNESVIYAPNHRSTLDPIILTAIIKEQIHWAALKRFFDGEDSIFNNSKNKFLCNLTIKLFEKFDYFPIERKCDNPKANNLGAIRDMNGYLSVNGRVGIFGEGTTNKEPEKRDFGEFGNSFLLLAKRNNSWVQPVTTVWLKDLDVPNKLIVNFGKPFKMENMNEKEALIKFLNIQKNCMAEIKEEKEKLINKGYQKVYK